MEDSLQKLQEGVLEVVEVGVELEVEVAQAEVEHQELLSHWLQEQIGVCLLQVALT